MTAFGNCPFGFEDGQIEGYEATGSTFLLHYLFWNEKRGTLCFEDAVASCDIGAIGPVIGGVRKRSCSELMAEFLRRKYESGPERVNLAEFELADLDGNPVLRVVARSCRFKEKGSSEG